MTQNYTIFESTEKNNSGIYTFTQLLKNIFDDNNTPYSCVALNSANFRSVPQLDTINIINIGSNSREAAFWLKKNRGSQKNIIFIHDFPVISNYFYSGVLLNSKAFRYFSRFLFKNFPKVAYKKFFSKTDILVATNRMSFEYLKQVRIKNNLDFKILHIDHPIYNPKCFNSTKLINSREIRIGTFGHLNKLKSFSEIPIAVALIKKQRPDIYERLMISIRTEPNDIFGRKDFDLLKERIINLKLQKKIIIGTSLPENTIDDFVKKLDILILPYRESDMMSSSGPVAYAMTYSKPVIGSGFAAKLNKYVYPFDINSPLSLYEAILDAATSSEKWNAYLSMISQIPNQANWEITCNKILNAELLCI
jgi:hypothetical protein